MLRGDDGRVSDDPTGPDQPPGRARGGARALHRRPRHAPRDFGPALGLTVLGAVLPGTAFLAAGRRRLGAAVLVVFGLLMAGLVWLGLGGWRDAIMVAVDSTALTWLVVGVVALAVAWALMVVAGYLVLRPSRLRAWQQALGAGVVLALCAGIAWPASQAVGAVLAQRDLVDTVFADRESATVTDPVDDAHPFGDREEVNILLLGGDGGDGRDGVRTDTVIVANIQTGTGETTLFSLPRNLQELPFPEDSPLHEVWPDGFDVGSESESLLNAVYRNGPAWYPDILGPTDDLGADMLKLGVGEALGLQIDYFVLVNLEGFSRLVDALGGIDVNVNYWVPVNGIVGEELPDDYIAPGPDQHLDGPRALDFARGRYGLSDYQRMDRQRCVIDAIVEAADPVTLLSRYRELAATTQDIVSTDIPQSLLDDVVDLAFLVQDTEIRSVVFDDTVITPAYPDYDRIRSLVQQALDPAPGGDAGDGAPADGAAASTTPPAPATGSAAPSSSAASTTPGDPAAEVADACAYDPVQAQEARAEGKPPTKRG
ncbi:LytR family transcriptional attenuator [Modestobacter roseus]|uniref:LytR family transcriptional attenuator n=1 Tax=Modestobacter roseus TaxID=1181884 RepID=A0A562IWB5_9ACTN|nr:LytR family transcriptional attenuator [Modestobacter roseus]